MRISHTLRSDRRGTTAVELVGAVLALVAGAVIGLVVIQGSDSEEKSLSVAQGGSVAAAEDASEPVASPSRKAPSRKEESAPASGTRASDELKSELQSLRHEISLLRKQTLAEGSDKTGRQPTRPSGPVAARADSLQARGQRTLDYWNAMNRIMEREEAMRALPSGGLTRSNASDFLRRRGSAGRYASQAIRSLKTDLVDEEVVSLAEQIAAWYQRGTRLSDQAEGLHQSGDGHARRGSAGQQWSSAEKSHHRSVSEINRTGDKLRRAMHQKYGLDFPDLR